MGFPHSKFGWGDVAGTLRRKWRDQAHPEVLCCFLAAWNAGVLSAEGLSPWKSQKTPPPTSCGRVFLPEAFLL